MKNNTNSLRNNSVLKLYSVLSICIIPQGASIAHQVIVHENITYNAAYSALQHSVGYREFLDSTIRPPSMPPNDLLLLTLDNIPRSANEWMVEGSAREDDAETDSGGKRSYNHFYDPLAGEGLSDFPVGGKIDPYGRDSFTWASLFDSPGLDFYSKVLNVAGSRASKEPVLGNFVKHVLSQALAPSNQIAN
jgi:hypothetical protein